MKSKEKACSVCSTALALAVAVSGCGKGKTSANGKTGSAESPAAIVSKRLAAISAAGDPVT